MQQKQSDQTILENLCGTAAQRERALRHIFLESGWTAAARQILKLHGATPADADDAIAESLIVFDRQIRTGRFDPARGTTLRNYFLGICVQVNHSLRRSQKRIVLQENSPETTDFSPHDPETELMDKEKTELLRQVLGQLDEHCRELLRLYKLSFSMREITEKLQISSENLARKQAFDCRQKLFRLFEANPFFKKYFKE